METQFDAATLHYDIIHGMPQLGRFLLQPCGTQDNPTWEVWRHETESKAPYLLGYVARNTMGQMLVEYRGVSTVYVNMTRRSAVDALDAKFAADKDPNKHNLKTKKVIASLQSQWLADGCWDIENTEGFEAHREELLAWRKEQEALWEKEEQRRKEVFANGLGLDDNPVLADYLNRQATQHQADIKALRDHIEALEGLVGRLMDDMCRLKR